MSKVRVKICGITRNEDLAVAVAAGADAVGFVVGVSSSPRNISLKKAEKLIKSVPIFVKSVLVMVPTSIDDIIRNDSKLTPDVIQIHGDKLFDASLRKSLPNTPIITAINANSFNVLKVASEASKSSDAILLDSFAQGKYGGTGTIHDWHLSKRVKKIIHPTPLILAGGLEPANVKDAVFIVQPYAVDVSSGVESQPGVKDPKKIIAFIKNAKDVTT